MSCKPSLDLTVAIPCHDDTGQLTRLLQHLNALNIARQVIVVDDGSLPPPPPNPWPAAAGWHRNG